MFKRFFFNQHHRYSKWDGSQKIEGVDADDILNALADDYMQNTDLRSALQRLQMQGFQGQNGQKMMGLRDLMERLKQQQQQRQQRYNMSGVMDDIRQKIEQIKQHEREGIQRRLDETASRPPSERGEQGKQDPSGEQNNEHQSGSPPSNADGQPRIGQQNSPSRSAPGEGSGPGQNSLPEGVDPAALRKMLERLAQQKQEFLDHLPRDPSGQIRELTNYDFMDAQAREEFQQLLQSLQQQVMQQYFQGMQQSIASMTPEDIARMREMIQALNQMMRDREAGRTPDFDGFMEKYGDFFGPGINSLDDLIADMQQRMAQMQALMDSMSPEQREQLQDMMDQLIGDDRLRVDLAELSQHIGQMNGGREPKKYQFSGDEPVSLTEAMRLMGELQGLDDLEAQMQQARRKGSLDGIDNDRVRELVGAEDAAALDDLKDLLRQLEEAGYIQKNGNRWQFTARGLRKIGQKALQDMFANLGKDAFGQHALEQRGAGGERTDDTKPYVFGDPFLLDMKSTLMNAIERGAAPTLTPPHPADGAGNHADISQQIAAGRAQQSPVISPLHGKRGMGLRPNIKLTPDDFEVYRTELITQSSTVLMIDMSLSMIYSGASQAAKKVAVALESLIRGQFPRDHLDIVGFSRTAREFKRDELVEISEIDHDRGTNMVHGLILARQLLARHKGINKQIIMVTDGSPTMMWSKEQQEWIFAYETYDPEAVEHLARMQTLIEAKRCTREGITINTFMLVRDPKLVDFVSEMAQINKGRAFFTAPEDLGRYLLVDYLASKQVYRQG